MPLLAQRSFGSLTALMMLLAGVHCACAGMFPGSSARKTTAAACCCTHSGEHCSPSDQRTPGHRPGCPHCDNTLAVDSIAAPDIGTHSQSFDALPVLSTMPPVVIDIFPFHSRRGGLSPLADPPSLFGLHCALII